MSQESNERPGASPNHPARQQPNLLSTEPTLTPEDLYPHGQPAQSESGHSNEANGTFPPNVSAPQNGGGPTYDPYSDSPANAYPSLPGTAAQPSNANGSNAAIGNAASNSGQEDSPDLLRWRADSLLDEMILGSADGSATYESGSQDATPNGAFGREIYDTGEPDYSEGPAHDGSPMQPHSANPGAPLDAQQNFDPNVGSHHAGQPNVAQNQPPYGHVRAGEGHGHEGYGHEGHGHEGPSTSSTDLSSPGFSSPAYGEVTNQAPPSYPVQENQPHHASSPGMNSGAHAPGAQSLPGQPGAFQNPANHQGLANQQASPQFPNQQQPGPYQPVQQPPAQHPPAQHPSAQHPPAQSNLRPPTAAQHYSAPDGNAGYGMNSGGMNSGGMNSGGMNSGAPLNSDGTYGEHPMQPGAFDGSQPQMPPQGPPMQAPYPPQQDAYGQGGYPAQSGPRSDWGTQPSFEQGYSPRTDMGYDPRYGQERLGQERLGQERNQQPLDPATYYAQQIAWRREQERKQWAISSGSSSDYLTSVPRYEEVQNRTANYYDQASSAPGWQNERGYPPAQHQGQGYPNRYEPDGYNPQGPQNYAQGGLHANPNYSPQLGPINPGYGGLPTNMPFAERMDVGAQAQRHSNLLPRRSQMSVDALYEEMTVLQSQVDMALPIYGDSADRAMHLLEKGRTILEQNPERSAEVAYYVQQVSGIIQRGKQRLEWSDMYRSRLSRYLTAWLVLGCLGLIGSLIYGPRIVEAFSGWFPAAARFFSSHLTAILLVLTASVMGSALAALTNMWRHSQKEYGFFDRKYGLLGVLLPIMGIAVGLAIYFIVAIIYLFLGITPTASWLTMILPALLALIYAASQERIYGTSE